MVKKWKILSEKDVSPSRWFPVFRQKVELPNKKVIDYFVSRFSDCVMIVAVTDKREIVFARQYRNGIRKVTVELPAGSIDKGETALKAARRELREETGYEAGRIFKIGNVIGNSSKDGYKIHCFFATGLRKREQMLDETEDIEVLRIPVGQVNEMIDKGKICTMETISTLAIAKRHVKGLL